ncbi:MAG: YggS family pyridoxal phosphate-dependent enzyme [Bifidobacterium merycicum]|uniref:YggS family pyridoxal phosphate-dependent enzyme n=1 Tax=Bifidobacterium merycicum TaxID=78345 RepID=UPI002E78BAC9|nr:YggS family pyridoxal phosphate-dependent enzyme [Bifidobacterium merycicum]MEE1293635.1 YggS family pyridoxal phosphate-dependent enzyme [Bifidobacterium merycicum]MEE3341344.1 YggS family pyridoxal phosphate-dependent enzyme [Bifidobacterium merycicum]
MTAYMDHKDLTNETIGAARARDIADNVHKVLDRIAAAEAAAGREAGSVRLLAATKTRDVGEIMAAIDAGVRMIGENRPQEVQVKAPGLVRLMAERGFALGADASSAAVDGAAGAGSADATGSVRNPAQNGVIPFHLIGQLQSNKIGKILPFVDTIESVDSIELAEKIARRAVMRGITVGVLLEVNESGEASKSGCPASHAIDLARRIGNMGGLELRGLMTIGAHVDDETTIRSGFVHLRRTRDQILTSGASGTEHCTELSMGMTGDMELAIAEGATIVRVGTGIFGERAFV